MTTMLKRPKRSEKEPPTHYFEIELDPEQRAFLLEVLRRSNAHKARLRPLIEAIGEARRINAPLVRARLDWTQAENEARQRGSSLADWLWDKRQ
jgi:hypothetical protein